LSISIMLLLLLGARRKVHAISTEQRETERERQR
jgi:hypothetical protein